MLSHVKDLFKVDSDDLRREADLKRLLYRLFIKYHKTFIPYTQKTFWCDAAAKSEEADDDFSLIFSLMIFVAWLELIRIGLADCGWLKQACNASLSPSFQIPHSVSFAQSLITLSAPFLFVSGPSDCYTSKAEDRLFRKLFRRYNQFIRPVENVSDPVTVEFEVSISQLVKVVSHAHTHTYTPHRLKWRLNSTSCDMCFIHSCVSCCKRLYGLRWMCLRCFISCIL